MKHEELVALFLFESSRIESQMPFRYERLLELVRSGYSLGHVGAWKIFEQRAAKKQFPTRGDIFNAHHLLLNEQIAVYHDGVVPDHLRGQIGCWRSDGVQVGDEVCPPASLVPSLMHDLMGFVERSFAGRKDSLSVRQGLGNVNHKYLKVHPHKDGNGRLSRLYTNAIALACDVPLIIFTADDRHERYYPAAAAPTAGLMREYVCKQLEQHYPSPSLDSAR